MNRECFREAGENMAHIITAIHKLIGEKTDVVLATIVASDGSTPRSAGSKMAVLPDGSIIDTIGGGQVENRVIKTAMEIFDSSKFMLKDYHLNARDADSMDMICGGRLSVSLELLEADDVNQRLFETAARLMDDKKYFLLVTSYPDADTRRVRRAIVQAKNIIEGDASLSPALLKHLVQRDTGSPGVLEFENRRYFIEPFFRKETVFIFGGGHISKQLAALANMVDFHTVVLDDRKEFANASRFRTAETKVIPRFENAFDGLDINEKSYIIIVTRGHIHDQSVLRGALKTNARYVGMIGSLKKRDTIFSALLHEGFPVESLRKVYSPIGLDIGSETPQEIAISIIAELISVRRESMNA